MTADPPPPPADGPGEEGEHGATDPAALRAEVVFPSSARYLPLARGHVRWFCGECGFADPVASRLVLAVVEAITNIIRHAYDGAPEGMVRLRARQLGRASAARPGVEFELLDRGRYVERRARRGRRLEDVRPGGLGEHMIRRCLDEIHCEPRPGGGTRLVLRKYLEGGGDAGSGAQPAADGGPAG